MVKVSGSAILVGLPEDKLPQISAFVLTNSFVHICGSHIGSKEDITEMLALAAKKGIKPW